MAKSNGDRDHILGLLVILLTIGGITWFLFMKFCTGILGVHPPWWAGSIPSGIVMIGLVVLLMFYGGSYDGSVRRRGQ